MDKMKEIKKVLQELKDPCLIRCFDGVPGRWVAVRLERDEQQKAISQLEYLVGLDNAEHDITDLQKQDFNINPIVST